MLLVTKPLKYELQRIEFWIVPARDCQPSRCIPVGLLEPRDVINMDPEYAAAGMTFFEFIAVLDSYLGFSMLFNASVPFLRYCRNETTYPTPPIPARATRRLLFSLSSIMLRIASRPTKCSSLSKGTRKEALNLLGPVILGTLVK